MVTGLLYTLIIYPIIFILPAWIANGTPVIFGGGAPLDFNKKLLGKPILGKHKTIRGTISGLLGGFIITVLVSTFFPPYPLTLGAALMVGAVFGDLLGSFIKRRANLKEGASVIGMDQYLFFITALLFAIPFGTFPSNGGLAVITVLTGLLHKTTNMLAHKAKIKRVPW